MARRSTIETHPKRKAIERDLVRNVSFRDIAKKYGVSREAARRWKIAGMPHKVQKAVKIREEKSILDGGAIADELETIRRNLTRIVTEAFQARAPGVAVSAIDKQLKLLQTVAILNKEGREDNESEEYKAATAALKAIDQFFNRHPRLRGEFEEELDQGA